LPACGGQANGAEGRPPRRLLEIKGAPPALWATDLDPFD
jgi:hypothetical protein